LRVESSNSCSEAKSSLCMFSVISRRSSSTLESLARLAAAPPALDACRGREVLQGWHTRMCLRSV
jgi:hypothetical protein